MDDRFYLFTFDKNDSEYGEYIEFPFPTDAEGDMEYYAEKDLMEGLSHDERKDYYNLILANLETSSEARRHAESIYTFLLQSNKRLSPEEIIFIGQYTIFLNYEKMKYDENGNVKEGYEKMSIPPLRIYKHLSISKSCDASGISEDGFIGIDYSVVDHLSVEQRFSYIQVLSHEMRHFQQEYEYRNHILNDNSFGYYIFTLSRFDENKDTNYWFETIELDAEEHGDMQTIDIVRRYAHDSERESLMEKYTDHLDMLRMNKSLAFAFCSDRKLYLTDIADIMWVFKEFEDAAMLDEDRTDKDIEHGDSYIGYLVKDLKSLGLIPDVFVVTDDNKVKLASEKDLLTMYSYYSHSDSGKKAVLEKALKFLYTFSDEESERFSSDGSLNVLWYPMKSRFIMEQLEKEQEFLEYIKMIRDNPEVLIRGDSEVKERILNNLIKEIMGIRIKRIQHYKIFLEIYDKQYVSMADNIISSFKNVAYSLRNEIRHDNEVERMLNENFVFDIFDKEYLDGKNRV